MKTFIPFILSILMCGSIIAQSQPEPAEKILKETIAKAKKEHKKAFIIFHASWCTWCKKMDKSMNDEACKALFDKNYVVNHIVVLESKGKENLNNPGSMDMLKQYKGDKSGIPFWLIFDENGKLITDSKLRAEGVLLDDTGTNVGCPSTDKEIADFIFKLKRTSKLNDADLEVISAVFKKK
ncbi:MAG: thioredoxin family protein [Bacteroidota bacterium]|nr:thioredoxin family protein [Bacteroidota bacterium]